MIARGILFDLQGVLYQDGQTFGCAPEAVRRLADAGVRIRFLTNTTTRPRREIAERMARMGFEASEDRIFTPCMAARRVLQRTGARRVHLAADAALAEDLAGFELVEESPDAVVLGDLGRRFDWDLLNRLFGMLRGGAMLIALHKNRHCLSQGEVVLDLGPFVAALEYAARIEALVVGKPAGAFFSLALADMDVAAEDAVMVGDDLEADIGGGLAAGLRTVQVRTGKYRTGDEGREIKPWARIESVAELPSLMGAA